LFIMLEIVDLQTVAAGFLTADDDLGLEAAGAGGGLAVRLGRLSGGNRHAVGALVRQLELDPVFRGKRHSGEKQDNLQHRPVNRQNEHISVEPLEEGIAVCGACYDDFC